MSTAISWVFEAAIKPDGLDDYRALAREIVADNEANEPGQTFLEWFIDDHDVHIYERYVDSAAALTHVQRFVANFVEGDRGRVPVVRIALEHEIRSGSE